MANWNQLMAERGNYEINLRKEFLKKLYEKTGRDIIVYYSACQTKNASGDLLSISHDDRIGFQSILDENKDGNDKLDLILHTPGGDIQATKMIISALRQKYADIRVIVPITAMSAGTMIALASNNILISNSGNLGPIDPQLYLGSINAFIPANEIGKVISEAKRDINSNKNVNYWYYELSKYPAAIHLMSENVIKQSKDMTLEWLKKWMFKGDPDADSKSSEILNYFSNYNKHLTHGNHLTYDELSSAVPNLKISLLESDSELKDLVDSVFYSYDIFLMQATNVVKIIEGHNMVGRLKISNNVQVK